MFLNHCLIFLVLLPVIVCEDGCRFLYLHVTGVIRWFDSAHGGNAIVQYKIKIVYYGFKDKI